MNRLFILLILACFVKPSFSQCRLGNESCICLPQAYINCFEKKSEKMDLDYEQLKFNPNLNYQSLIIAKKNINKIISYETNETISLSRLTLNGNKLTSLGSYSFKGMKKLADLILTNNQMVNIEINAFFGLDSLRNLDLRKH
jgi:hypothetical protein